MSVVAVQPGRIQLGGPLVVLGSSGPAVTATFTAYVLPTAAVVMPNDTSFTDIDPVRAVVMPNDTSFTDIDPIKVIVIQ